jgi:hypothetical protein
MDALARAAEWFIGIFQNGAGWFTDIVVGIIPLLIILLTGVNALIAFIGQERLNRFAELAGRITRQPHVLRDLLTENPVSRLRLELGREGIPLSAAEFEVGVRIAVDHLVGIAVLLCPQVGVAVHLDPGFHTVLPLQQLRPWS